MKNETEILYVPTQVAGYIQEALDEIHKEGFPNSSIEIKPGELHTEVHIEPTNIHYLFKLFARVGKNMKVNY